MKKLKRAKKNERYIHWFVLRENRLVYKERKIIEEHPNFYLVEPGIRLDKRRDEGFISFTKMDAVYKCVLMLNEDILKIVKQMKIYKSLLSDLYSMIN